MRTVLGLLLNIMTVLIAFHSAITCTASLTMSAPRGARPLFIGFPQKMLQLKIFTWLLLASSISNRITCSGKFNSEAISESAVTKPP